MINKGMDLKSAVRNREEISHMLLNMHMRLNNLENNSLSIEDVIVDGILDKAPSQNAVYDSLMLKANVLSPFFTGLVSADGFKTPGGLPTQFLKADGSLDSNVYLTAITSGAGGELTGSYPNPLLLNSAVIGKTLAGFNITGGAVLPTDSILIAIGKLQGQFNGLTSGLRYKGPWDANTNTPNVGV